VYAASLWETSRVMTLLPYSLRAFMVIRGEGFGMTDQRLSFKEMCAKFDVTPRTLRYYEYIELLQPDREGRSRWYGPKEVARMTLILRGRKFGFQLEDIRQWLLIYEKDGTEAQNRAWIALADRQLGELAEQRTQLDDAIDELQKLRDDTVSKLSN
jgi:DNA-binding transcriptional MerR regulator